MNNFGDMSGELPISAIAERSIGGLGQVAERLRRIQERLEGPKPEKPVPPVPPASLGPQQSPLRQQLQTLDRQSSELMDLTASIEVALFG